MKASLISWFKLLDQLSVPMLYGTILVTVLAIGGVDHLTGYELSLSFLYLIPVSMAAWRLGEKASLAVSAFCAFIWLLAVILGGESYSYAWIPFWNAITRGLIFALVGYLLSELRQTLLVEQNLSRTDVLTGVLNRRAFHSAVEGELSRVKRFQRPATLLYVDIDNFKAINDEQGHQMGDQLLEVVAQTIMKNVRAVDTVARLGGDEFAVLLPETGEAGAKTLAPRLRWHLLAEMTKYKWPVTFSIGALTCRDALHDVEETIRLVDQVMYDVKRSSKDGIAYAVVG
ncbi:MAG TPA: GGDEF domain-containing protein [Anaerolineales bacterium]|nr:GGDEF domain-containing protein [Anaerolineales bacterium]